MKIPWEKFNIFERENSIPYSEYSSQGGRNYKYFNENKC